MKRLLVIAGILACAVVPASAQSWGRGGAYTGASANGNSYYPRTGAHSCTWSVTAACAAWRNGVYATRTNDGGVVRHQLVKRFPNGRYTVRVYQGNTRVK